MRLFAVELHILGAWLIELQVAIEGCIVDSRYYRLTILLISHMKYYFLQPLPSQPILTK